MEKRHCPCLIYTRPSNVGPFETFVSFYWHCKITGSNKCVFLCWLIQCTAIYDFFFTLSSKFLHPFSFFISLIIFNNRWLSSTCLQCRFFKRKPIIRLVVFREIYIVVQFFPWFKFYFPLFKTHYHTLPYPKQRKIKFKPRKTLNHNIYSYFEKGCRKKCTWQSWKALWVVLSSLFFREIWKNWHERPWKCVCEC